MKDLLEKLSSYNIFNYLLPGIVFVVLAEKFTTFHFIQQDIVIGIFFYYLIGLIISRLGSLIIEPFFKWSKFVKFAPYADFVRASKEDKTLEVLSEVNNMYRTLCSLFLSLFLLKCFDILSDKFPLIGQWVYEFLLLGLLALFCFSYRKQTKYITKRIQSTLKRD